MAKKGRNIGRLPYLYIIASNYSAVGIYMVTGLTACNIDNFKFIGVHSAPCISKTYKKNFVENSGYISQISKQSFSIASLTSGKQSANNKYCNSSNGVLSNS
jgi:hypothetical protein